MDATLRIITVYALPIIFAITIHEAAHGYVARHFGDNTAYMLGRVTLNPLKHIDPWGTIVIPVFLAIISQGAFTFGYAKPVPVNFANLRNPKKDMVWVALAGPAVNFVQAIVWALLGFCITAFGVHERFFDEVISAGILVNPMVFAFNLFPLPPLDGGRVLTGLLPRNLAIPFSRLERYGLFIVLALLALPFLRPVLNLWVYPLAKFVYAFTGFLWVD